MAKKTPATETPEMKAVRIGPIAKLYLVARDEEYAILDDLRVRAGLAWECPIVPAVNENGTRCIDCGLTQAQTAQFKGRNLVPVDQWVTDAATYALPPEIEPEYITAENYPDNVIAFPTI